MRAQSPCSQVDQLETRLEDQFKALGYGTASSYMLTETNDIPMPKQATDLIKEIALLEMEVVHLEHYLLSLYRKAFDQQITPNSESKKPKSPSVLTTPTRRLDFCEEPCTTDPLLDDGRDRVDPVFTVATPSVQHLRRHQTSCLKEWSSVNHRLSSSPNSSLSSSAFSPSDQYDTSSPGLGNSSSLDNSFHVEGEKDFSGECSNIVEVLCIHRDSKKANEVADLLHYFKTLISRLEEVDPSKLKHEEKLAFWINVHNALGDACKLSFFEPINLGRHITLVGHTISAEATQSSILGCKMSHPGQKFKAGGDERLAAYAINHLVNLETKDS
ncbi:hypothetical protein HID58_092479 [Brassica napus]|uniref:Ternary complex factor MIP1 leucine-zipper domain-containing protein n=1 Tax=Brassica napus TaxID=3708 RepID=A0ABQ7WYN4_BRANA|nr:hypothetical protein HID58_092479 [Brassica napus]